MTFAVKPAKAIDLIKTLDGQLHIGLGLGPKAAPITFKSVKPVIDERQQSWRTEELKYEILRLSAILRRSDVSEEEKAIALSMLSNYKEQEVR
jgi:hypothetical protein